MSAGRPSRVGANVGDKTPERPGKFRVITAIAENLARISRAILRLNRVNRLGCGTCIETMKPR